MTAKFKEVLEEAQKEWMDIEGVMSVAQGKKSQNECIDVYITGHSNSIKKQIPEVYKGYTVVFRESGGPFKPQS